MAAAGRLPQPAQDLPPQRGQRAGCRHRLMPGPNRYGHILWPPCHRHPHPAATNTAISRRSRQHPYPLLTHAPRRNLLTARPYFPDSVAVIAVTPDGTGYTQHYFDSRGVVRTYAMTLDQHTWTLLRDRPDFTPLHFAQRFTATFTTDGNTITATWESSDDG